MNVIHPPFVHFVVALPLAALFSQLTYLGTKDITYAKASTRILALSLLISFFAVYGGLHDANTILNNNYILEYGKAVIAKHKIFGFLTLFILFITTLIKWIATMKKSFTLEKLSLLFIIFTILTVLYEGNMGGSIVYKYSGGIDNHIIQERCEKLK
ncbi:hypothetical protein NitYY0826_C1878 [Nitratiruptor sp. YY08-26]|uniref:DUF2231 domain-containing protein n=1 Tax=unclassified Nitratiruptor TaxID=2624044 RepID=UPI0019150E33|nr:MULTISPECIES: DUF2231 domain-containing protein [unclassified Nitratiruptor]BCD62990.1 hypothetical protein NitYY0813_C1876 [Nitratiruptor sp. YY08-13]BCD66925.1 hypothetical protein NitYY0826_C1878 [Nitratiruptor sp. YY08-26]